MAKMTEVPVPDSAWAVAAAAVLGAALGATAWWAAGRLTAVKAARYEKTLRPWARPRAAAGTAVVLTAALCALCGRYLPAAQAVCCCLIFAVLICGSLVDLQIRIIPNECVLAVLALGAVLRLLEGPLTLLWALAAAAGMAVLLVLTMALAQALTGGRGLGAGDFKMILAVSVAVGWPGVAAFLAGFALALLAAAAVKLLWLKEGPKATFPMCPCIAAGAVAGLMYAAVPALRVLGFGL